MSPALPAPLVTAVTVTATYPDGLSASLAGYFSTDWESQPSFERAVLGQETPSGDDAQANRDRNRNTARSRAAAAETARQSRARTAACNGSTVEVTFDLDLRTNPAPAPTQFTVNFTNSDGSTGTITARGVSVNGRVVTLTLESTAQPGQVLTLDYVHRDGCSLTRSTPGGDSLGSFRNRPIRNVVPVEQLEGVDKTLVSNLGKVSSQNLHRI